MKIIKNITKTQLYKSSRPARAKIKKFTDTKKFALFYRVFAVMMLLATTLLWSILSARINQFNADQLVDPLLFESADTFKNAQFPSAHSFLFKWPLFYAVKLFGYSPATFITFTVLCTLLTVGSLAFIIYKIEKRPLVFGTIILALASILALVPTTPHPGALLPVNMAMLATRNLEYVMYIGSLVMLIKAKRMKSRWFVAGVLLLGLLIASDKLFLSLTLGGALIALVIYALAHGWNVVSISANWLVGGLMAGASAVLIYWLLATSKITHIIGQNDAGPYGLVTSIKSAVLAIGYMISGLLTNFGANPAFHTVEIKKIPIDAANGLVSVGGFGFLMNMLVLLAGGYAVYKILRVSLAHNRNKRIKLDEQSRLALMLIYSTFAAMAVFIATDHYYAVDSRYLAIAVFAVFVSIAVYARKTSFASNSLATIGLLLVVTALLGSASSVKTYHADNKSFANIDRRNRLVAKALDSHKVDVVVGDYWRTVPTRVISDNKISIMPLANCTLPREALTSKDWNKDLNKNSFAYLLSLDKSLTDFPTCTLDQVVDKYGKPNASLVMEGSLDEPKELLLFYDNGIRKSAPTIPQANNTPSTVTPISLDDLPNTTCDGPTIMNIVAHQDDDLLFMNPDLYDSIKKGYCVRTIYLTAGDAGGDEFYWLRREKGAQAAYDSMLTSKQIWVNRIVKMSDDSYINVTNPRGNSKISLIFLHLPDGNIKGQGFARTNYANIERLHDRSIQKLSTIDNNSSYTSDQLVDTLNRLMVRYYPTEIRTQSDDQGSTYRDHSDHNATGRYAKLAYDRFEAEQFDNKLTVSFKYYMGYPVHEREANVTGQDLVEKQAIFLEYAKFDGGVCHSEVDCNNNSVYGIYLGRQYAY